jgi:hypothetical protein
VNGLLSGPIIKNIIISPANIATNVPAATTPTLTISKSSGLLSGSFLHSDTTKPTYQGVILQKGANAGGWGYFMSAKPKLLNFLGESGAVRVIATASGD